jgi:hypothetical protein
MDDPKPSTGDIFKGSTVVSKLTTAGRDGSKTQKWNAPADIEDPAPLLTPLLIPLKNIGEK